MVLRLKLGLVAIGIVLCLIGYRKYKVSSGATKEPMAVGLSELEKNSDIENTHLKIGEHWAIYPGTIFEHPETANGQVTEHTTVTVAYYPIVSIGSSYGKDKRRGGPMTIRHERGLSDISDFAVLVKTKRFEAVGNIPHNDSAKVASVTGLVVNRITELKDEEKSLIQQGFPKVNLDKVLILEEGLKPTSPVTSLGMIAGGVVLILAGLGWLVMGFMKKDEPQVQETPAQ